jgi:Trk-type K+ transport system membrane component
MEPSETLGSWLIFACNCAFMVLPYFIYRRIEDPKARKFWRNAHAALVLLLMIGYLMR